MTTGNSLNLAEIRKVPAGPPHTVRPTSMTLDITHACNFRCPGCIEHTPLCASQGRAFRTETACKLISQFVRQGGGEEVLLYGGEPSSHAGFPDVVRHAAQCACRINVVTNGSFLHKPYVAGALREAATRAQVTVRVSLNSGTAPTHEKLHRAKGYFGKVVVGMRRLTEGGSAVHLGVSFLLEEANAAEIKKAYRIAAAVGAQDFYVRPKTGLNGIDVLPMSVPARRAALDAVQTLSDQATSGPAVHVSPWHLRFLATNVTPDTSKPYPACYYCAASRLIVTPPEPGRVWACTFWRADPRFFVADLGEVELGSPEFEDLRQAAVRRIRPGIDCASVICNRHEQNLEIWDRIWAREREPVAALAG
ncbi:MAG: radical SAM protein [Kiritimatiellae bacterium]|nr:radical SAM protein [Kiritimatiellia bacterium]